MRAAGFGVVAAVVAAWVIASACSSHDSFDCSNGACSCPDKGSCDFTCGAPPCHVSCGTGSQCSGQCANGECTCAPGASCAFTCEAPPCHVTCEGDNPSCSGTCANGTCSCAAGSTCRFACTSGPCHTMCPSGASCAVRCPNAGVAGTHDCDVMCANGRATTCSDGLTIACGAPCPTD